jgi:hypothetical protein
MKIRSFFALALVASSFAMVGCADPCGEIADCCNAQLAAIDPPLEGATLAAFQAVCDSYNEADDDACQAAIDAYVPVEGVDVPAECEF